MNQDHIFEGIFHPHVLHKIKKCFKYKCKHSDQEKKTRKKIFYGVTAF